MGAPIRTAAARWLTISGVIGEYWRMARLSRSWWHPQHLSVMSVTAEHIVVREPIDVMFVRVADHGLVAAG